MPTTTGIDDPTPAMSFKDGMLCIRSGVTLPPICLACGRREPLDAQTFEEGEVKFTYWLCPSDKKRIDRSMRNLLIAIVATSVVAVPLEVSMYIYGGSPAVLWSLMGIVFWIATMRYVIKPAIGPFELVRLTRSSATVTGIPSALLEVLTEEASARH